MYGTFNRVYSVFAFYYMTQPPLLPLVILLTNYVPFYNNVINVLMAPKSKLVSENKTLCLLLKYVYVSLFNLNSIFREDKV